MRALTALALAASIVLASAAAALAAPHDTTLVSRASAGAKANGASTNGAVSGDGRYVVFSSTATNLSPDDGDTLVDLYRRDLAKDSVELVSRASGTSGAKAAGSYFGRPSISADGRVIAFMSDAPNLSKDDPDNLYDIFVRDLATSETVLVSRASGSDGVKSNRVASAPAVSADGRFVAFASAASNLVPEQPVAHYQVYVRDLQARTTTLVSRVTGAGGAPANRDAQFPAISGDGRYVTFSTGARNLAPGDTNQRPDVFVRDLVTDTTTLVSRSSGKAGAIGGGISRFGVISSSGRVVAFPTTSRFSAADTDNLTDVYVRDIGTSTTTLVSRASGASGAKGDFHSGAAALSGDGRRVAFISGAANLSAADVDAVSDVYVRDLVANTTTLVSRAGGAGGAKGNAISDRATISADGDVVAFDSRATNLSPADPVPDYDQYVRELPVRALLPFGGVRAAAVRAPVRRWYRVSAEVTLHKSGDFSFPSYTDHRETNLTLRLRSRTAFILFHQCVALANPVVAKDLSLVAGLQRSAFTCTELKQKLREHKLSAREIRNLHLTDDVRFTANGEGFLDGLEQTINVPERPTGFSNGLPGICPAQTTVRVRVLGLPVAIGGLLRTGSAARTGVLLRPELDIGVQSESGTLGAPCFDSATREPVGAPGRLIQGRTSLRLIADKPDPERVRFKIGRRFGRSFAVTASPITTEPLANGMWTTTSTVTLKFTPCPCGGRDVNRC